MGNGSQQQEAELNMAAPKGNQFWKVRTTHGRDAIFADPLVLWDACQEYFEWVEENPLLEDKLVIFQGSATHEPVKKMRAMTINGLCVFLGIGQSTWFDYAKKKDFSEVTTRVDNIIRDQKFSGAAADLLNANIIARDLGLADKSQLTGADGKDLIPETSALETMRQIAFINETAKREQESDK
jgi:hypothetical protein